MSYKKEKKKLEKVGFGQTLIGIIALPFTSCVNVHYIAVTLSFLQNVKLCFNIIMKSKCICLLRSHHRMPGT